MTDRNRPRYSKAEERLILLEGDKGSRADWGDLKERSFPGREPTGLRMKYIRLKNKQRQRSRAGIRSSLFGPPQSSRRRVIPRSDYQNYVSYRSRRSRLGGHSNRNNDDEEEESDSDPEYIASNDHAGLLQMYTQRSQNTTMNTTQGFFPPQAQAGRSIFNFSQSTSTVAIQTPTPRPSPVSVQSNCRAPMDQPPPATSTIADSFSSAGSSLPLSSSHDGMVPQCSAVASQSSNSPAGSAAGPTARPTSRDEFVIEQVRRSAQAVTDYIQSEKKDRETILTRLARLEANSPKYSTILNTQKTALDALTQSKDADVAALTRQLEKQGIEIQLLRVANTARDNEFTTLKRTVDEHRTEFREWDRSSKEHIATLARKFEDLTEGQIQVCVRFDDLVRRTNDVHSFIRRLRDLDDRPWRSDGAERM